MAQAPQSASSLQPVQPGERIYEIDALRGFALFGVLVAYTVWNLGGPPEETYSQADRIINRALLVLVDSKFYTLFAILFGLGFSIQLSRAAVRGINVVPVYCRRLVVLLLIGLVHALLLRNGDILVPYAITGFLLIPLRNASNKVLALVAIIALLYPYLARHVWELSGIAYPQRPGTADQRYLAENFAWVRYWYSTAIVSWPASLPMFVFGMYLGRVHFFDSIAYRRALLRIILVAGLIVGSVSFASLELLNNIWTSFPRPLGPRMLTGLLWSTHAWGIAAFYASSLILILQHLPLRRLFTSLSSVGRMALTNYILQAGIVVPLSLILGLFDRVTPSLGVLLAFGVAALQVPLSVWWLKRYDYGPAEWIWRSLTYGRFQQMQKRVQKSVAQ